MNRSHLPSRPSSASLSGGRIDGRVLFALLALGVAALGWTVGQWLWQPPPAVAAQPVEAKPEARKSPTVTAFRSSDAPATRTTGEPINPLAQVPESSWFPRPEGEWQGMKVDMAMRQECNDSKVCGLSLACLDDGKCGACTSDSQCATGEACVLDHCVLKEKVECRSAKDCGGNGAVCMLSGLTGGTQRGNDDMRAYCQANTGGEEQTIELHESRREARNQAPQQPRTVHPDDLFEALDK